MKKNHVMRISAIVLALVLATACLVSGTFAKYVTSATTDDAARVAKWGVTLDISNSQMFTNEYATDDTNYSGALSVKSIDDARVVAPGTKSGDDIAPLKFGIAGTPETAVRIDFENEVQDICLKAGTYTDYTKLVEQADGTFAYTDTFTLTEDYYPVKWTLQQIAAADGVNDGSIAGATATTLANIKNVIGAFSGVQYAPNTVLDAQFQLDWEWAFEQNDAADTYLGNCAAGIITDANAILDVEFDLTITATQID